MGTVKQVSPTKVFKFRGFIKLGVISGLCGLSSLVTRAPKRDLVQDLNYGKYSLERHFGQELSLFILVFSISSLVGFICRSTGKIG